MKSGNRWPAFIFHSTTWSNRRGAALLIALTFLVLLSAVVLALFGTTRTDRQNASTFATGQETMRLADAAVNLVQGQIRDATIQPRVGWASQPGMIRTFGTSGNATTAYKLYSSDEMVVSNFGKSQIDAETTAMSTWNLGANATSYNALYCDLNSPAAVKRPQPGDESQTEDALVFPIADPAAIGAVEGFSANTSVAGTVLGNATTRRLPMPVKWIYVLRDGQMTAPTSGDATKVNFSGSVVPTQSNPIVGRIAFWTDDDTCKLNINTASEGVIWETPRANTYGEQRLAASLPVEGEFQRLPGHPSTTSLAPVFGSLIPPAFANGQPPLFLDPPTYNNPSSPSPFSNSLLADRSAIYNRAIDYFNLTPRIFGAANDMSSKFGLRITSNTNFHDQGSRNNLWPSADSQIGNAMPLIPDTDRLYATVDELLFSPNRSINNTALNATEISKRDFFLTAISRAPETTILGLPRVSLWPVNSEQNYRTVKDRLLEFCSRLGTQSYYFDREVGNGFLSSSTGAVSATKDITRSRNSELLEYLKKSLTQNQPFYSGSFASKWGGNSGLDKVLVQAFDIVRSTNVDYVESGTGSNKITYRYGAYANNPTTQPSIDSYGQKKDWTGQPRGFVTPSVLPSGAKGLGRSLTFSQFAIVIMACKIRNTYSNPVTLQGTTATWTGTETSDGINGNIIYNPPLPPGSFFPADARPQSQETLEARAFLVMQPFNPTPGGLSMAPGLQVEISGDVRVNGVRLGTGTNRIGAITQERNYIVPMASLMNIQYSFITSGATIGYGTDSKDNFVGKIPSPSANDAGTPPVRGNGNAIDVYYPFVSAPIPIVGNQISFSGGTLNITLRDFRGESTIQKIAVEFPETIPLPAPQHMTNGQHFAVGAVPTTAHNSGLGDDESVGFPWDTCGGSAVKDGYYLSLWKRMRLNGDGSRFKNNIIRAGDIVLGVQLDVGGEVGGDLRKMALTADVPANWFKPIDGYPVSTAAPASYLGNGTAVTLAQVSGRFNHALRADLTASTWYANTPNSTVSSTSEGAYLGKLRENAVDVRNFRDSNGVILNNINNNTPDQVTNKISSFIKNVLPSNDASIVSSAQMFNGALLGGSGNILGDWGSGNSNFNDGAVQPRYEPGIVEGNVGGFYHVRGGVSYNVFAGPTLEPNRNIPSSGVLGSILTPDASGSLQPWQTLLVSAIPAGGTAHPGFRSPPDHLFLDNFWMPVVEPFAVSEPLSTAGKVNLNSQIAPFVNITRTTSLNGVLRSIYMSAVRDSLSNGDWKAQRYNNSIPDTIRYAVDVDRTVDAIASKWANPSSSDLTGDIYLSATQICEVPIVPEDSGASLTSWWSNKRLTSDTLREQPYTALLSRVTTKSNTFTVHYRVQALRQPPRAGRNWAEWDEARDQVVGEYRGSTTIERFLDPNAQNIPDYTQVNLSGNYDPIDKFYRWRVLSQKQFAP